MSCLHIVQLRILVGQGHVRDAKLRFRNVRTRDGRRVGQSGGDYSVNKATMALLLWSVLSTAGVADGNPVVVDQSAIEQDWALQDGLRTNGRLNVEVVRRIVLELGTSGKDLQAKCESLLAAKTAADDPEWLRLYQTACKRRRLNRLRPYLNQIRRVVFTKHCILGGSHYAYTENLTDAQYVEGSRTNPDYRMGAALCLLEIHDDGTTSYRTLIESPEGLIRDPDVSYDGRRVLFAMRRSADRDDFHLYELETEFKTVSGTVAGTARRGLGTTVPDTVVNGEFEVEGGTVRQLTSGEGVADYEGQYLPNGDIIFNSTRPVQIVDCWWTDVSNLYTCDKDGQHVRRVSFDQVHTNFPTVTHDGDIVYTRWDYSDRGQIYPQALFQMNPDGTGQTEFYGNNSWFPTTILHARSIPGTRKVVAILTGHHTHQRGWLGILDPAKGCQENSGAQLIAPVRPTPADHIDQYGQSGPQFQYPYPLGENAFLVTMDPIGSSRREYERPYAIYWIDVDGRRELLVNDATISCNQSIPLRSRSVPPVRSSYVNDANPTGVYYVQDVYSGKGLEGIARGTVKKLRVVAIEFRAAGIRSNFNKGVAGAAMSSTPVSVGNGCWDPKTILGDATVYEDGSACFEVPAKTPVYFQALDADNHAIQTMRSWSTLQPGESFSCVGCHESRGNTPSAGPALSLALQRGPQRLEPFHGPARGFSFAKEIQPILDRHCVSCHDDRTKRLRWDRPMNESISDDGKAFSLLGVTTVEEQSGRRWSDSYLALTAAKEDFLYGKRHWSILGKSNRLVNWISVQSAPPLLPPYSAGASRSGLVPLLRSGHGGVHLAPDELDRIAAWIDLLVPYCGDYTEANAWTEAEKAKYQHFLEKRQRLADAPHRSPSGS